MTFDFQTALEEYQNLKTNSVTPQVPTTRLGKLKPFLVYKPTGTYGYIENYQSVCKYSNRTIEEFFDFFATHLGCKLQKGDNYIRTHGVIKLSHFHAVENLFYSAEVLCPNCNSPETKRVNLLEITCGQCGRTIKNALKIKKK